MNIKKMINKIKIPKPKKRKMVMRVGIYKKPVIVLWIILICSLVFAVYKNFTAINIKTVEKQKIVELQLIDTQGIASFVQNFAETYYSWDNSKEAIENRKTQLSQYLTDELIALNNDDVRVDIPTSSKLNKVQIWSLKQINEYTYLVKFEINQTIKESSNIINNLADYTVKVHVDNAGNMVIIQNPTISSPLKKSGYKEKPISQDNVDINTKEKTTATTFLETFFKLYPKADLTELSYYVQKNQMQPINKDYTFVGIENPIFIKQDKNLRVKLNVKYIDNVTKAMQISQYDLLLAKSDNNWKIKNVY